MKYAVLAKQNEKKDGRYIQFCDDCCYDGFPYPLYKFTLEEAHRIAEQMKNHYCYVIEIIGEDGVVAEKINWLKMKTFNYVKNPKPATVTVNEPSAEISSVQTVENKLLKKPNIKFSKALILKNLKKFGCHK